jgi:hypothetical protein
MVSPKTTVPTYARNNKNGYLSSILAWLGGSNTVTGFYIYKPNDWLRAFHFPSSCYNALTTKVSCDTYMQAWTVPTWHGSLASDELTQSVCSASCGKSLATYHANVERACPSNLYNISGIPLTMRGGSVWQGYNETCLRNPTTNAICNGASAFSSRRLLHTTANMLYR